MKNKEKQLKLKLEDDLELLEMIIKSKSDIKNSNVISQKEVKRRLGYKDKKCKENA